MSESAVLGLPGIEAPPTLYSDIQFTNVHGTGLAGPSAARQCDRYEGWKFFINSS